MIHNLYKLRGETPLERIHRLVAAEPELKRDPEDNSKPNRFTYLGRLDPMAEGVLLIASGEDVKNKQQYLGLDKEYEFTALFGFATDTYDVLGKILRVEKLEKVDEMELIKICEMYKGERDQEYPFYSSKMISSRESFSPENPRVILTDSTRSSSEKFPSKKIKIHDIKFHNLANLNAKELFGRLLMDISKVTGDFRQHEILVLWREILLGSRSRLSSPDQGEDDAKREVGWVGSFSAHVSSGTYIRGIVNDIGNTLGIGATTLSIRRTRVGDYRIEDSLK